ncbi:MAG: S8 family peptidase, partial [Fimbriimonadaceae bacterium]
MFGTLALLACQVGSQNLLPIEIEGMLCHPNRLMVKVDSMETAHELTERGYRLTKSFPKINWVVVETDPSQLRATRSSLSLEPGVKLVAFDRAAVPTYTPNDAKWVDMWHARTIKADLAWDISFGNVQSVTVAIIDTGVNTAHPDLAANLWRNKAETAGNSIDDDGNGYVDDINGYDFAYNDPIPNDVNGHGTACAGLAAAVQDNTIGVTGVAPKAKIMCLKASIDSGYFYDSNNVGAYLYALDNGAKVISCSFFSDRVSQIERDAIDALWAGGVLPVVAAGNDNSVVPFYPAAYEKSLAVAATDQNDNRAGFSNFGSWVDVACPGVALRSTTAAGGYTDGFGGTSGACPQVAGLAALLLGAVPGTTNADLRACIEDTATALTTDFSKDGLINCQKAMQTLKGLLLPAVKSPKVNYMTPVIAAVGSGQFMNARLYGRG